MFDLQISWMRLIMLDPPVIKRGNKQSVVVDGFPIQNPPFLEDFPLLRLTAGGYAFFLSDSNFRL